MQRQFWAFALVIAATLATAFSPPTAMAAENFSRDDAKLKQELEAAYDVKVLRIRLGEIDGLAVYVVTVMNPAGNFNDAFQVTTLAVDRATGKLVSQYRQTPTGQQHPDAGSREPLDDDLGATMRLQTERRLRER